MILRAPCPKCRQPMLAGVTKCANCSYRPTPWEVRNARRMAALKVLLVIFVVVALIYAIRQA